MKNNPIATLCIMILFVIRIIITTCINFIRYIFGILMFCTFLSIIYIFSYYDSQESYHISIGIYEEMCQKHTENIMIYSWKQSIKWLDKSIGSNE